MRRRAKNAYEHELSFRHRLYDRNVLVRPPGLNTGPCYETCLDNISKLVIGGDTVMIMIW